MTDTLVTAVGNVIARVLIMEPLAVPDASYATKRWIVFRQTGPYWVNRPVALPRITSGSEDTPSYQLGIQMRLVLAYIAAAHREDYIGGTENLQDNAWEYIPATVRYFEKYRLLDPPSYTPPAWLDPIGTTITTGQGLQIVTLPGVNDAFVSIDFNLTVPLQIGTED